MDLLIMGTMSIAKMLKDNEPDECTYIMIWKGKQMVNYIEY